MGWPTLIRPQCRTKSIMYTVKHFPSQGAPPHGSPPPTPTQLLSSYPGELPWGQLMRSRQMPVQAAAWASETPHRALQCWERASTVGPKHRAAKSSGSHVSIYF